VSIAFSKSRKNVYNWVYGIGRDEPGQYEGDINSLTIELYDLGSEERRSKY